MERLTDVGLVFDEEHDMDVRHGASDARRKGKAECDRPREIRPPAMHRLALRARETALRAVVSAQVPVEDVAARPTVVDAADGIELAESEAPFALAGERWHRRCFHANRVPDFFSKGWTSPAGYPTISGMPCSTVLIIEDDPDAREVLGEILRSDGYSPVVAKDGREGLATLRAGLRPCLIVLDMLMPGMDGWQFRRAQNADRELADIPVVVVSGVKAARNSALSAGAVAFLAKPVAPEALLSAVAAAC